MPLDLGRLSRRRAIVTPTPSEEFVKHDIQNENIAQDDVVEDVEVSTPTPSDLLHDDTQEYDDSDYNNIYLQSYADGNDNDNDDDDPYDPDDPEEEVSAEPEPQFSEPDHHVNSLPAFVHPNSEHPSSREEHTAFTSIPSDGYSSLTDEETEALLGDTSSENEAFEDPELNDDAEPKRQFMFAPTPLVEEAKLNQSFSYTIETFAIEVMNASEITNVSLSSFGDVGLIYEQDRLSLIKIGKHKFIGRPLSALDKQRLFYTINEFIRKSEEDGKASVAIKLTQRVLYRGVPYTSLVAAESELSEYAGIFGKTVYFNPDEPDELNLVAVIRCKE